MSAVGAESLGFTGELMARSVEKGERGKFSPGPATFGGLSSLKNITNNRMRHFQKQNLKTFSPRTGPAKMFPRAEL